MDQRFGTPRRWCQALRPSAPGYEPAVACSQPLRAVERPILACRQLGPPTAGHALRHPQLRRDPVPRPAPYCRQQRRPDHLHPVLPARQHRIGQHPRHPAHHLPRKGWGRIVLAASASRAGTAWTDHGTARQERGLKHRATHETRTIPIPPELVKLLRTHIKRYGTTPDGRIFQTGRGGILQDSAYGAVWIEARKEALTTAQCRSPLGRRPYDLRHAAVSLWLNSGVPATEVARRAGHGVAVLLKIYAHCIDGQADAANKRITDALGTQDSQPQPEPGDEGDDDIEQDPKCQVRGARPGGRSA